MNVLTMMDEGGMVARGIVYAAPILVGLAAVHATKSQKWSLVVGCAATALPVLLGVVGTLLGRQTTDRTLAALAAQLGPANTAEVRAVGYAESARNWQLGLAVAGLCLIFLVIGEVRRAAKRPS